MSIKTKDRWQDLEHPQSISPPPPLKTGDRLLRAEFERRYEAHPEIKQAELIEGVVYVASPVFYPQHGRPHFDLITWLGGYRIATLGIEGGDNATLRLDDENEPQPDILLRLDSKFGGRSRIAEDNYLEGSPELIVEVAATSVAHDLQRKKQVYARHGVPEYLVAEANNQLFHWFTLHQGVYHLLLPDDRGILRSRVFPGLWLQPEAFWVGDMATVLAVLQEGLASSEHAAFVTHLRARQSGT